MGFQQLGELSDVGILVHDFMCDALPHSILQPSLIPIYYPVNQHLILDWQALESIATGSSC